MGIKIVSNPPVQPAVVYDYVHVTQLSITQPVFENDADDPVYEVLISYLKYGIIDGVRHYRPGNPERVSMPDFIAAAAADAAQGDMTLYNALASIEQAVAAILKDQGVDTTVV